MSITLDWDWATRTGGNLSPQEYRHLVVMSRDVVPFCIGEPV